MKRESLEVQYPLGQPSEQIPRAVWVAGEAVWVGGGVAVAGLQVDFVRRSRKKIEAKRVRSWEVFIRVG
jgi:hypothetical protein